MKDLVGVCASVATAIGGIGIWLFKASSTAGAAHVRLGICEAGLSSLKADVEKEVSAIKAEARDLRDQHIRADTILATMTAKLDKLDQITALVAAVESMRTTVDRLDRLVVPRPEIEQLSGTLMERVRLMEERALRHD